MLPQDIASMVSVAQPALSPDGTTVAFVVVRADEEANDYLGQIWLVPADGSAPARPFTSGERRTACPAWSPDGTRLAYTSTAVAPGAGARTGTWVHVAPVSAGGEAVRVASFDDEVVGVRWSPDGRLLAVNARTPEPRYDHADERRQPPRRVTRLFSRLDDTGFTVDRPLHVYAVPADGIGAARNLTPGPYEFHHPQWVPGSRTLVVDGSDHDTWDLDLVQDVHVVDVDSGVRRALTGRAGAYDSPSASPDGGRVAYLGTDDTQTAPRNAHVGVVDTSSGERRWLSHGLDRTFRPFPDHRAPVWLDGDSLLVTAEDRGDVHLYRVRTDASDPEPLWQGPGVVTGFDAVGGTVVLTLSTPTSPAELFVLDPDGDLRALTDVTARFAAQVRPRAYDHFTVPSADGAVEIDAWMLTPEGFDEERSYPVLVNVHGGPFTQYANRFFDEFQMQARAGYVVVWCNPRGGSGREESFGRAICGPPLGGTGWGSVDFDDVMAVVDHVVATRPFADGDRLGILGGSYGGYMTSWAVGHTDRFRAACSERAANNLLSLEWASDAAGAFRTMVGAGHLDDPDLYRAMSPVTYVRDIETPLLIVHAERDLRCPIEQADQMFVALRLMSRDVEMVRFPAESHEMSRSGSPVHRRQRAEVILEFFERHLKP